MSAQILTDPLKFPDEIGPDARSLLTGLLTRDPAIRLGVNGAESIKAHLFFSKHIDFKLLMAKKIQPPFKPSVVNAADTSNVRPPTYLFSFIGQGSDLLAWYSSIPSSRRRHRKTASSRTRTCLKPYKPNSKDSRQLRSLPESRSCSNVLCFLSCSYVQPSGGFGESVR